MTETQDLFQPAPSIIGRWKVNTARVNNSKLRLKPSAANPQDVQMANDLPAARKVNPTLVEALNKNNRKLKRVTVDSTSKNMPINNMNIESNFSNQIENTKPISERINEKKEKTVKKNMVKVNPRVIKNPKVIRNLLLI